MIHKSCLELCFAISFRAYSIRSVMAAKKTWDGTLITTIVESWMEAEPGNSHSSMILLSSCCTSQGS